MVFESLVVDLMNRYLGDFIENLDRSQLKIGIWGGDVVLNNLYIKESALDDLDLPVKILHGNLGKLTLKIPWKNLYGAPTVASLEGLYVVAVPKIGVAYNEEKEKKAAWESKQKELQRIEDAKKAETEKNKPADPKQDSFAEKLATNIIKNLQVEVGDIHVRYEDRFTNPQKPFSIGVTLKGLSFQTTDENWTPKIIKESVSKIYKMIKLDSLAVYWNSKSPSYVGFDKEKMLQNMKGNIIGVGQKTTYQYLIEPISSSAQLQLNTKPEQDNFSIPKIILNVVMEQIGIALAKNQYQDVMEMLESFERLNLASKHRKFRPSVQRKGHAKEWWHFAYNCIMEDVVRRRRKMWSWQTISAHRKRCREYKAAYKKKLGLKKVPKELQTQLDQCEEELSVFNITLMRQQAELEAKKEGIKPGGGGGGWFSGWLGGGKKTEAKDEKNIGEQFQALITPEEKAKMYEAIGYQESSVDPKLPIEFVATKLNVQLKNLKLSLRDMDLKEPQVVNVSLKDLSALIAQRPAASAVKVETTIDSFSVTGVPPMSGGSPPMMVSSQTAEGDGRRTSLLDAQFETNPLDGGCDTRVNLNARPLEIVYDAQTINLVADFFKPPESVHLRQLQAAAMAKFEELKEQTATGLQHAIEQRKYTEITVNIKPTRVIMPDRGVYRQDCKMLLLELGELNVNTEKQPKKHIEVGTKEKLDFDEVMQRAYDKFKLRLTRIQLLFVNPGDDWKTMRTSSHSPLHILRPMDLNVDLSKCMIHDTRIPKMKIQGDLPKLDVSMSDERLHDILQLIDSIPFPKGPPPAPEDPLELEAPDIEHMVAQEGDATALARKLAADSGSDSSDDEFYDARDDAPKKIKKQLSSEFVNATDVHLQFEIKEICVQVSRKTGDQEVPMVKLVIEALGTEVKVRTFDLSVHAYLGGIYLQHLQFKANDQLTAWYSQQARPAERDGPLVNLINTPITDESTFKLLTVEYLKAKRRGPEFSTTYQNTEQKIKICFSALEVLLHQEAILSLIAFAQKLVPTKPPPGDVVVVETSTPALSAPPGDKKEEAAAPAVPSASRRKKEGLEIIDVDLEANLDVFSVAVCTDTQLITDVQIKGLTANVTVQKSKTCVAASLKDITVYDPTPGALYPKILAFEDEQVFSVGIVVYNGATDGDNYCNMQAVDLQVQLSSGCMKVVFLNKFVMSLLTFLNQFQVAKDKMAEASAAARDSAVQAASELSDKATRISLSIKLKAPVIIVPQHSASNNALIVDLGKINIGNKFEVVGKMNAQGRPAVLDRMTVELTSLKLSRALMMGTELRAECLLLEPVTLQVDLVRNLSAGWYHGHPDIDVSGKLKKFAVGISQGDYASIMSVLNENLKEGVPPPAPAPVPKEEPAQAPSNTSGAAGVEPAIKPEPSTTASSAPTVAMTAMTPAEVWAKIKFSFTIEAIKLELYNGDSNLSTGFIPRDQKQSLGRVQLQFIGLCGNIKSNNAIEARVMLFKCVLDDTRPNRENGITKMVEHSAHLAGVTDPPNMIDLTFKQAANQNKDIDIHVSGLYICVCLEYLMSLGDFFTKATPGEGLPLPALPATTEDTTAAPPPPPEPAKPDESELNVRISVDKPEIVMVENPMCQDTNALMLDVQVAFELKKSLELMYAKGTISQLQITSCIYSTEKRESSKNVILSPVDITLFSKDYPLQREHRVDISVSDVVMNISPASIRTVTATLSSLSKPPPEESTEPLHGIPKDLWETKKWANFDFWFLKEDVEPLEAIDPSVNKPVVAETATPKDEQLIMQVSSIVVKMEGGIGRRTVPFILTEMAFTAEVRDWSSKLCVGAELSLEVAYYNEMLAVWEPVIEPVEDEGGHRPWELKFKMAKNTPELDDDDPENEPATLSNPVLMSMEIRSTDILQTTLTKSCLEVLTNLGKSFGDAYQLVEMPEKTEEALAPYIVKNESGTDITIKPDDSFKLSNPKAVTMLSPGERLDLFDKVEASPDSPQPAKKSAIKATQDNRSKSLCIVMENYGATRELKVLRAQKTAFGINQRAYPGEVWHLVSQTDVSYGCKTVTLRSILQIKNHLPFAMEVYYKLSDDCKGRCGEVKEGGLLNVPMDAVYAAPYELFFKPRDPRYLESVEAFQWKNLSAGSQRIMSCLPSRKGSEVMPLHFGVSTEVEDIMFESTNEKTAKSYMLHFQPALVFRNSLPMPVTYQVEGSVEQVTVEPGERKQLMDAKPGESTIILKMDYHKKQWVCAKHLEEKPEELSVWSFEGTEDGKKVNMDLGVHMTRALGYPELSLYCPYWMVNKTGRELTYKSGDDFVVTHPSDHQGAVLFSFKSKSFFSKKKDDSADSEQAGKKSNSLKRGSNGNGSKGSSKPAKSKGSLKKGVKASLKLGESEWSDKFSLDTIGSSGTVSCKFKGQSFTSDVGVKITLASSGLTKICTFTPYVMLINQAKFAISCRENIAEAPWTDVQPGECLPYWPVQTEKKMQMLAKVKDAAGETQPFYFNQAHTTLLKLSNEYCGLNVECNVMEAAVNVIFQQYRPGYATARIINHTEHAEIQFYQGQKDVKEPKTTAIMPGDALMYTWEHPLEKRELLWTAGDKKQHKTELVKDDQGNVLYGPDYPVYWLTFLDGMQRVMLFTDKLEIFLKIQKADLLEVIDQEIVIALYGLGLSLVNNHIRREVAYISITSSGAVWEERKKKKRYKPLKGKYNVALEDAWTKYRVAKETGLATQDKVELEGGKLIVDFKEMVMIKPHKNTIRRQYQDGLWLQYHNSTQQTSCHLKVNRFQLDNQIPGAVFPTVLAPIPPPKSVAAESDPKPFTEVSIMIRKREFSSVKQFKYFKVLVQEMSVKMDQGFLGALITLFSSGKVDLEQERLAFVADCESIDHELMSVAVQESSKEQKHYYDQLHFSPLKVHLSFSMTGSSGDEDFKLQQTNFNVLGLFLQSVGIVLTDIDDVVFKLGFFERKYTFYNQTDLTKQITWHYSQQAIKQMYVLVLGLDVLGNPFGLIRGLADGLEDLFYEPYQGAIQGPEEFAEGLALGVRSLLGHAVGGAAGAVSRITGALGKGIASLTMDDEYQRKRRENLNKKPADLKEGLARGGKGLVMGVVDGVTGIVTKPVEGAKQDGVGGFFKGVGKGMIGVVTRPASGVVDFASSSFEGIKRVAEMGDEVRRIRPPRYLHKDMIVRAYNYKEAEGNEILADVDKGKYVASDGYVAHMIVTKDLKNVLLVTDKRVIFASKGEIFGHWDTDWQYVWEELKEPPNLTSKGIQVLLKEKQKKSFFSTGTVGKLIPVLDKKRAEWIVKKINATMSSAK